jgi:hypothetical protein
MVCPSIYHVACTCGENVQVQLFQAGTTASCPSCKNAVSIPGLTKLKELSGDLYPHLAPIDKVLTLFENHQPPFDGICQRCRQRDAAYGIPVEFKVTVERHIEDDGGIRASPLGLKITLGASETHFQIAKFPLLLCKPCSDTFRSARSMSAVSGVLGTILLTGIILVVATLIGLVLGTVLSARTSITISAAFVLVVVSRTMHSQFARQGNRTLKEWLHGIPWISDALAAEEEYSLSSGSIHEWRLSGERLQTDSL